MKKLSLYDFRRMCDEKDLRTFLLRTIDQGSDMFNHTITAFLKFENMLITLAPNSICFKSNSSAICFEMVKYVYISEVKDDHEIHFNIVCGDLYNSDNDVQYVMVAY